LTLIQGSFLISTQAQNISSNALELNELFRLPGWRGFCSPNTLYPYRKNRDSLEDGKVGRSDSGAI